MGNAHVDLGWSRLIKLEQQFPAQGQNLRAEEDFLRVHLESVPGRTDGFSDCTIERLRFRQQSEESSEPQSGSNPPPYTRQALSDCATPARVPPRFARAQPVMMWARFEAELVGPGWFRSRRRWRSPQTREFFADAASAALPIRHTTPPTIANGAPKTRSQNCRTYSRRRVRFAVGIPRQWDLAKPCFFESVRFRDGPR